MQDEVTLEIQLYRPEEGEDPFFQSYSVPYRKDWVILDALNYIKDQLDGTLSYRWSCGMMVNGKPVLTCGTFLGKFLPGPIRVEPLVHFPVIRDLVIETNDFLGKLKR